MSLVETSSYDGSVGLVLLTQPTQGEARAVFFQWTEKGQAGRVASLDDECRLKTIVPTGQNRHAIMLEQRQGSQIILPGTSIFMQRFKKGLRPRMPEAALRLRDMAEFSVSRTTDPDDDVQAGGSGTGTQLFEACQFCSSCSPEPNITTANTGSTIPTGTHVCSMCCVVSHPACASALATTKLSACLADGSGNTDFDQACAPLRSDRLPDCLRNSRTGYGRAGMFGMLCN